MGINGRRVFRDESLEAVGEDGVGEAEEQGAGNRLAEHGERHGDGNLSRRQGVLNGDDGLKNVDEKLVHDLIFGDRGEEPHYLHSEATTSSCEDLISDPFSC